MNQHQNFHNQDIELEKRKSWYSGVADAYDKMRPSYTSTVVEHVCQLAQLPTATNVGMH